MQRRYKVALLGLSALAVTLFLLLGIYDAFFSSTGKNINPLLRDFRRFVETKDRDHIKDSCADQGYWNTRFGEPEDALQWLCNWYLETDEYRALQLRDPYISWYVNALERNDFAVLKAAINAFIGEENADEEVNPDETSRSMLILASPGRKSAEQALDVVSFVMPEEGGRIADLGAGLGFYSLLFSSAVGPDGRVYALEVNRDLSDIFDKYIAQQGLENIETRLSGESDCGLPPGSVDRMFLFVSLSEFYFSGKDASEVDPSIRTSMFASLREALTADGKLIICEKNPVSLLDRWTSKRRMDEQMVIDDLEEADFAFESFRRFSNETYCVRFRRQPD